MKVFLLTLVIVFKPIFVQAVESPLDFSQWASLSLQDDYVVDDERFVTFQETDFELLKHQAQLSQEPMMPVTTRKVFNETLSLKSANIRWRVFMTAIAGNKTSGFSQGIGMTTMLMEDRLFLDVQVEHLKYNFKNRYYDKYYEGDKYRYATSLHWRPTDEFSLHLGISGIVDK